MSIASNIACTVVLCLLQPGFTLVHLLFAVACVHWAPVMRNAYDQETKIRHSHHPLLLFPRPKTPFLPRENRRRRLNFLERRLHRAPHRSCPNLPHCWVAWFWMTSYWRYVC